MYWDLLKVDLFRYVFKQMLGFFCCNYSFVDHPGMYFALVCLVCSGACLSIRVDKVV